LRPGSQGNRIEIFVISSGKTSLSFDYIRLRDSSGVCWTYGTEEVTTEPPSDNNYQDELQYVAGGYPDSEEGVRESLPEQELIEVWVDSSKIIQDGNIFPEDIAAGYPDPRPRGVRVHFDLPEKCEG